MVSGSWPLMADRAERTKAIFGALFPDREGCYPWIDVPGSRVVGGKAAGAIPAYAKRRDLLRCGSIGRGSLGRRLDVRPLLIRQAITHRSRPDFLEE
ncbi:hypothetical protein RCH07_002763 [Arthrobacter sp. CG_A4]|nr:hypothetical protein [Arthrobacter sp. CG_A4]